MRRAIIHQHQWAAMCRGAGVRFTKLVQRLKITPEQLQALKAKQERAS
jgi:hypothetical protein